MTGMSVMRSLLERLSRNIVIKRKLPDEFGKIPLLVSPGASLGYWRTDLRKHDPMLLNAVQAYCKKGQVIWDVGANVGLFSFAAAARVGKTGKILAVEADTWCVNILQKSCNLKENSHLDIDVLPVAISDEVDIVRFNIAQRGRAANFMATVKGSSQTGGIRETRFVPSVTLDWLAERFEHPDFIKIDIEGAEALALKGAYGVFSDIRPKALIEVSLKNQDFVTSFLHEFEYVLYDPYALPSLRPIELAMDNTIAVPAEI